MFSSRTSIKGFSGRKYSGILQKFYKIITILSDFFEGQFVAMDNKIHLKPVRKGMSIKKIVFAIVIGFFAILGMIYAIWIGMNYYNAQKERRNTERG